jgi:hypothetical protein
VERAFSAKKIIKTDLSNKMGDEWLNHRMVCYIERDVFTSIPDDDILQYFQELKSRLKKLPSTICYNVMLHSDYKCIFNIFYDLFIYILILFICRSRRGDGRCEYTILLDSMYIFFFLSCVPYNTLSFL